MTPRKPLTELVVCGFMVLLALTSAQGADKKAPRNQEISARSPDGAFAMRITREGVKGQDDSQSITAIELVALPSKKVAVKLMPDDELGSNFGETKLLWSPDSKRCAFYYSHPRVGTTSVFERSGKGFREVELPMIGLHDEWIEGKFRRIDVRNEYISPERWLQSGALVLTNTSILRIWEPGQTEADTTGADFEITLAPSRDGRTVIREVRDFGGFSVLGDVRDRAERGRMRGPDVRPGFPDAFEIGYEITCASPDGKLGILRPDSGVLGASRRAGRNFIVSTQPLKVLGMLNAASGVTTGLRANWNPAGTAAIITIESTTTPRAVHLLEFEEGRLVRKTDLLAQLTRLLMPDFRSSKAAPWSYRPFAIIDDKTWTWTWKDGKLDIVCRATSNPGGGGTYGTRVWWGKLQATWDLAAAKFADSKVTRLFDGVVPDDSELNKKDEDEEEEESEKTEKPKAPKPAEKESAWTLARSPDQKIQITWTPKSQIVSFVEEGKQPVQIEPKPEPVEAAKKEEKADEKSEEAEENFLDPPPLPFFSPNGERLLVRTYNRDELLLYTKSADGWKLEKPERLMEPAIKLLRAELGINDSEPKQQIRVNLAAWSADSTRVLLSFDGSVDAPEKHPKWPAGSVGVDSWLAYYNLGTGKFELTERLKEHNRHALGNGNGRPDDWELQAPLHSESSDKEEMPMPAKSRYDAADRKLTLVYEKLIAKTPEPKRRELRDEQRAWIDQRDLEASIRAAQGWSPFPNAARLEGAAIATEARVAELEKR